MPSCTGLPPVFDCRARVLVLGSMPGARSLAEGRYYAHPRNMFWPIMGKHCGFDPHIAYELRLSALSDAGIALWDVLGSCVRAGSLDTAIERDSARANDFRTLFSSCSGLGLIAFNGGAAEAWFRWLALDRTPEAASLRQVRLPSTSPAYAAMSMDEKCRRWLETLRDA